MSDSAVSLPIEPRGPVRAHEQREQHRDKHRGQDDIFKKNKNELHHEYRRDNRTNTSFFIATIAHVHVVYYHHKIAREKREFHDLRESNSVSKRTIAV